jgi:hypothetical protein
LLVIFRSDLLIKWMQFPQRTNFLSLFFALQKSMGKCQISNSMARRVQWALLNETHMLADGITTQKCTF